MTIKTAKQFCVAGILIASALFMLPACSGSDNATDETSEVDTASGNEEMKVMKAQNVFYSIPSPIETSSLLQKAGADYNADYLNPIENVSKYNSTSSKALNLGVYGSDLSFTSIFDQTQESMLYLKCANKLASGLGISGAFGESTVGRIEANQDNRDSLLQIISDAFWQSDAYLKENDRPNTSALIVAGGWIEGLYIATRVAETTNNPDVITRIGEQKLSLENLIGLLESCGKDDNVEPLLNDLRSLKAIYDKVKMESSKAEVSTDPNTKVTTIGGNSSITVTKEQLAEISKKVAEIRNTIISKQ
jgi:hypothetical protein